MSNNKKKLPPKWPQLIKERLAERGIKVSISTIHKTKSQVRYHWHVLQELKALELEFHELTSD